MAEARRPRWRALYAATLLYGVLSLIALWVFTRAYAI